MKLRTVTALCLVVYLGASTVITVVGLWAQPATSTKIATVTQPAETPSRSTKTEIPLDMEGLSNSTKTSQPPSSATTEATTTTVATPTPAPKTTSPTTTPTTIISPVPAPTPAPSPTPKPAPAPTPAPVPKPIACGQAGGICTAAQVATHKLQSNCWQIYNGGYYIVTSYVAEHPGGKSVFNSSTCGVDITGYMNGTQSTGGKKRRHSSGAYQDLESYYVGKVQG